VVEFNAEFEDPENCRLFRYSANVWRVRRVTGEYNESFTPIPPAERLKLLNELYAHAAACVKEIGTKPASVDPIEPDLSGENA